jgi:predicted CopG family antitoxin
MVTTIRISDEFAKTLNQLKYQYGCKSIEELLRRYINGGVKHKNVTQNQDVMDEIHQEDES